MLQKIFDALVDFALFFPRLLFSWLVEIVVYLFNQIPVPAGMIDVAQGLSNLPPAVVYYADLFQIGTGLTIVSGCLLARFLIRRIPIIG